MAAKKKTSQTPKRPRIFVQIASYRDPECQWTVKDLFEKAKHPERIFVGICWQFVKGEDDAFFSVPYPRPKQVRVHEVDARQSKGVCWARSLTQKLWKGEEFTLQIDSHMRFEPGWDETLLSMWEECGSKKAVLTSYPPGYKLPNDLERGWIFGMAAKEFDQYGIFLMHGKPPFTTDNLPEKPVPGAFASACMYFGPSSLIEDVPYDPYLYFFGEEISLAVRFWTHGYDLFHPNKPLIYHNWDRTHRKTHFSDHDWQSMNDRAFRRVKHLLGTEPSHDANITKDLAKYGLGKARSLKQYQEFSGVDFAAKTISEKAYSGIYETYGSAQDPAAGNTAKKAKLPTIFVQIASYRDRECQWTVKDLFEKARYPDRIRVGICWQFDEVIDQDCFQVATRPEQVRVHPVDWRDSDGVCWARYRAQQLCEGEEYVLQIDAHSRFVPDWDELMIDQLNACKTPKPLLSCSPLGYTPPDKLAHPARPVVQCAIPFAPDGYIASRGEPLDRDPPAPLNGAFISPAFIFARAALWQEVPADPYLYQDEEEMAYAIRLYTHGWDVFSPSKPLVYHYYETPVAQPPRPSHAGDLKLVDEPRLVSLQDRSARRFNHLTGFQWSQDASVIKDFIAYDVGRARALQQFEFYCGIDFRRRTVSEKALSARFINRIEDYLLHPVQVEVEMPLAVGQSGVAAAHAAMQKPTLVAEHKPSLLMPAEPKILPGSGVIMQNPSITATPTTSGGHQPKLMMASKEAMVFDDFLPEDLYQRVHNYVKRMNYERINTHGKISRAWHIHDNFPLRSALNVFYYTPSIKKPQESWMYPTKTDMDLFIEQIVAFSPHIESMIGVHDKDWGHVTATAWLYPPGTGLAMHDDGSGTYAGAYAYFLNPTWRSGWGGLNIMMDREANEKVYAYREKHDQIEFYERGWLDDSKLEELMLEHGMGKCIFPKKNRIVFISNYAYHMVTRVNEAAGDNIRTSIAGFFNFKHVSESHGDQKKDGHY